MAGLQQADKLMDCDSNLSLLMHCAAYEDLHQLYREWVDGIDTSTGRIAPLWELERLKRQEGLEWRSSMKIRKQVMEKKVLIYAVLRRLPHSKVSHTNRQADACLIADEGVYMCHGYNNQQGTAI